MTYAASSVAPSNQLESPSFEIAIIKRTADTIATSSGNVNTSGMLVGKKIEQMTRTGATNIAICSVEPTAISTAMSILFLKAIIIADACSAAFPTIATMMTPINS